MQTYMSGAEYKALSREKLLGRYGTMIGALACMGFLSSLMVQFLTPILRFTGQRILILFVTQFVGTFLQYMFQAGFSFMYLKIACDQYVMLGDVFYGFRSEVKKVASLSLILSLVSTVCMLPFDLWERMMVSSSVNGGAFLLLSVLGIAGITVLILVSLTFSQVFFLLCDFPAYTTSQLLSSSAAIMRGNKGRLFYLELSFVPLYLLGTLSLGLGFLWIIPYVGMTEAEFYLDTLRKRNQVTNTYM